MKTIDSSIIIKNEMPYVMDLINQLCEFSDEVHITDTGSTDGFLDQEFPDKVFIHHFKWIDDFAAARNYAKSFCNSDYIFWCDGDDVLSQELIDELKYIKQNDIEFTVGNVIYEYNPKSPREIWNDNWRYSIYKNIRDAEWHERIHEYLYYDDSNPYFFRNESRLTHKHNKYITNPESEHTNRNLRIFKDMQKKYENFSSRSLIHLGSEYIYSDEYIAAFWMYYAAIVTNDNDNYFKEQSFIWILKLLMNHKDFYNYNIDINKLFLYFIDNNIALCNYTYYMLGEYYYRNCKDIIRAKAMFQLALNGDINTNAGVFGLPYEFKKEDTALELAIIYYSEGNIEKFMYYNDLALKYRPDYPEALNNKAYYK